MAQRIDVAKVAEAVAVGESVPTIASRLGVPERTLRRRVQGHDVQATVRDLRATMVAQATGRLLALAGEAAGTLAALLQDTNPPLVRLAASRTVLQVSKALFETTELAQRVAGLEARLREQGDQPR